MDGEPRSRLRASAPSGYRWWRHVALVAAFQITGISIILSALENVRPVEWAAAPLMLLLILLGEWASHRYSMHRRVFPRAVHRRHVLEHHAFFSYRRMTIDGPDDLRWVLFPPWAMPLLVASVSPVFLALYWLATPNCAWLFMLVVIVYYTVYEVVHVLTHLEPGPGRLGAWHAAISRHHCVHHDPALMDRWNFNFALPLFDWLFGTTWQREEEARESPARRDGETWRGADSRETIQRQSANINRR